MGLRLLNAAGQVQFGGRITGGGALATTAPTNMLLTGNNDHSGGTTIQSGTGGFLGIGSDTAFGTGPVTVSSPTAVLLPHGGNQTLNNALTATSDFAVDSLFGPYDLMFGTASTTTLAGAGTSRTFTVSGAANFTLNAVAGGVTAIGLVKAGGGSLTLTGTSSYPGPTTVSAGTLIVAANGVLIGTGAVTVGGSAGSARAVLGGTGSVGGAVTVNSTGTVSPGLSQGILTVRNGATYAAGSTYLWELGANSTVTAGTNWDRMTVTGGTLSIDPSAVLAPSFIGTSTVPTSTDTFWQSPHRWPNVILLLDPAINNGGSAFVIDNSPWVSAGSFMTTVAQTGRGVDLVWTPVPEPAHLLFVSIAAAGILRLTRQRLVRISGK